MRSADLYESLCAALDADLMGPEERAKSAHAFDAARRSRMSPAELLGEDDHHAMFGHYRAEDYAQVRLDELWKGLLEKFASESRDGENPLSRVDVRSLPTRRIEASTLRTDDGALVLVDPAFHDFTLAHLALLLCSADTATLSPMVGSKISPPTLTPEVAADAAHAINGHIRRTGMLGLAFGVTPPQPLDQLMITIIEAVERFVLAHEAGHCGIPDHLNSEQRIRAVGMCGVAVEMINVDWEMEFEADAFAVRLIFSEPNGHLSPEDTFIQLFAVRMALFSLDCVIDTHLFSAVASHPPGYIRYQAILETLFGVYGHTAIGAVEDLMAPYVVSLDRTLNEAWRWVEDDLGDELAASGAVYFPTPGDKDYVGADAFWEHISCQSAVNTLAKWGIRNIGLFARTSDGHTVGGALPDLKAVVPSVRSAVGSEVDAFCALGEAWFRARVMKRLTGGDAWLRSPTVTFSDVLRALSLDLDPGGPLLYEAARVLQAYRKVADRSGSKDPTLSPLEALRAAETLLEGP